MAKLRQLDPNGITWHAFSGYPRLQNLATNPSFEASSGTVDTWKNHVTNPSFEAASGTVELRRNLVINPNGVGGTTGWNPVRCTILSQAVNYTYVEGTTRFEGTVSEVGYFPRVVSSIGGISVNQVVTASFVNPISVSGSIPVRLLILFLDVNGVQLGAPTETIVSVGGEIAKVTATAPANTASAVIWVGVADNSAVGTKFYFANVLVEIGNSTAKFFSGSSPAVGDFTYAWTGTANASASIQQAPGISQSYVANGGNTIIYQGNSGSITGTKVARLSLRGVNATGLILNTSSRTPAIAGRTYTVLGSAKQDEGALTGREFQAFVFFYNSAGTLLTFTGSTRIAASNSYVSPRISAIAPANTAFAAIAVNVYGGQVNDLYTFDNFLIVEGGYKGAYFDGSTTASGDFTYVWLGTANASQSVQRAPNAVTAAGGNAYAYRSTTGAQIGTYSLALMSNGVSFDSFSSIGGDTGAMRLGLQAGRTYTIIGKTTTPVAQTSAHATISRVIRLFYRIGAGLYYSFDSPAGPATGTGEVRLTATLPVGTTEAFVRLYNGSPTGGDMVYWDSLAILEGDHPVASYFDGSMPEDIGYVYSWSGPANSSTSIALPK